MSNRILLLVHSIVFLLLSVLAIITDGYGGGGDSLTHYFMARLAWQQPHFFMDLWGKPVFTLLASPFALLGFTAVKIFNVACGVLSSYFTCLVAQRLNKQLHWMILLIAFLAPAFYTYLFSGLTEPLAGLLAVFAVWLCLSGKVSAGFVAASFLPFARSEAQVFLLFFLIFGLLNHHYKKLPLLLSAHFLYAVISLLVFGDFFRALSSPYDSGGSVYGSGEWLHYIHNLKNMLAWPGIILAGIGLLRFIYRWFVLKNINWKTEPWLVHGLFFSLLLGHTVVWALGIYGSAGLERTLLAAFPFLWIIMLDGLLLLKDISSRISPKAAMALPVLALALQASFTFGSPASPYYWNAHMTRGAENDFFASEVARFIKENYPDTHLFVMDKPDMAIPLQANFMDAEDRLNWGAYHHPENVPDDALWIYDSYYVPVQYGISLETIRKEKKLKEVQSFEGPEGWTYVLFEKSQ